MKIETPLLRRLGPLPFWRGEKKCLPELDRLYKKAHSFAVEQREKRVLGPAQPPSRSICAT